MSNRGFRILVVDDNRDIHEDFRKVLGRRDTDDSLAQLEDQLFALEGDGPAADSGKAIQSIVYEIDSAFQGTEAIQRDMEARLEGRPYALIFMDVRMPPGEDGIKTSLRIWRQDPDVEIVLVTAYSDYSWNDMVAHFGQTDKLQFIRKPFDSTAIKQLALSLTTKWQLNQEAKQHIRNLEAEVLQRRQAQHALKKLNEELEQRVSERTRELSKANAELKQALVSLREAQASLVESEKMAALGGLVAGVAHEINTPVGIGVTAASHFQRKARDIESRFDAGTMKKSEFVEFLDVSREATDMILTNLQRASDLIQSFKRVAVDQSSEQRRQFSVRDYLEEILVSLRPRLKKTAHRVLIHCDAELTMDSFPGAFSQVISNLVMNSLIHGFEDKETGTIEIEVLAEMDQPHIKLLFRDDGKGMSAEHLSRVFDPFFTTKRSSGGSGLGLHIVYNLVTKTLAGTVVCESAPGQGTTFTMVLPRCPQQGVT